jgi:IS30 family transposase
VLCRDITLPNSRAFSDYDPTYVTDAKRFPGPAAHIDMMWRKAFTIATDVPVYFCAPAGPWQRGSDENSNGLLRQYVPRDTDPSRHSREHVAAELDSRSRRTLGWETPAERLAELLATAS